MGSIFRQQTTRPCPPRAETFTRKGRRFARWKDRVGRSKSAPLNDAGRIVTKSECYYARFRDPSSVTKVEPTGCADKANALAVLARLEAQAEKVRAGVLSAADLDTAKQRAVPLQQHVNDYLDHLRGKGVAKTTLADAGAQLRRLCADCGWTSLAGLSRNSLEKWLRSRSDDGMGAATRNKARTRAVAFGAWLVREARLPTNPFAGTVTADERADQRHQRRAFTPDEFSLLLDAAARRPLLDAQKVRRGVRTGKPARRLSEPYRARLEREGRQRRLVYLTLALTGLRRGELASIPVADVDLAGDRPCLHLTAANEKNRQGSSVPLRADLAAELRGWLAEELEREQEDARRAGLPVPLRLDPRRPLLAVPRQLRDSLYCDLALAGVERVDDRGRHLDVHGLRHSFVTWLAAAGVSPRTAQAAARHGSIDLTMNVYTDARLLDVHAALDALPTVPPADAAISDTARGSIPPLRAAAQ
jgi:integrase